MEALQIARQLIAIDSVSHRSNAPIAALMRTQLESLGFEIEQLEMLDPHGVRKISLVGRRGPSHDSAGPGIAYFCHNDVVPVDGWNAVAGGPFDGAVSDGKLWGRGACDMKGSAAAALAAISRLAVGTQKAPIYFVVTSDEEYGMHGAKLVANESKLYREMVARKTVGIIGEPTELSVVNSHKGGCYIHVSSSGVAAHSSTAEGRNANWPLIDFLAIAKQIHHRTESDPTLRNERFSPPTLSMNLIIKNRPAAANITVGAATCTIFLRPMPDVSWQPLADEIAAAAIACGLTVHPLSQLPPLHTAESRAFVRRSLAICDCITPKSVSYATDGCWFTDIQDLIVLGPGSIEQAHRPDEYILLSQLEAGVELYQKFFQEFSEAA